jgi:hypothetical protein
MYVSTLPPSIININILNFLKQKYISSTHASMSDKHICYVSTIMKNICLTTHILIILTNYLKLY